MSATVRVTIDGRVIEAPAGMLITDASKIAQVHIPIFCSHAKLPPLGACRICVVEVGMPKLGADRKPVLAADGTPEIAWLPKPQTACTTPVADGMHVRTQSPGAIKARKGVMEFLLVNHPLDCPVCDEGGECQLQDLAFAFGTDFSRMGEAKRTFVSEDLGPVVKKEANRCIVCMRCVRYCDEIMGEDALTAHQRSVWTEISSFNRQPLECEQCGNCVEVCPVGALTALPYRFKARPWDLRQHITICPWCSNGCSVRLGVRGLEVLRARGTEARGVNQEYLCVRGRFGYEFVNHAERLSAPLMRLGAQLSPAGLEEAVAFASSRLREIAAIHGPDSIAFLGGEKLNVEEQYLFQKLAREVLGTPNIDARTRATARVGALDLLAATGGGRALISFAELGEANEVLVMGDDLQGESPFAQAVLVRGQHQRGVHLTVAHPRRVKLARGKFGGDWLAVRPGGEVALLAGLARAALAGAPPALGATPAESHRLEAMRAQLKGWNEERVTRESGVPAAAIAAAAKRLREAPAKAILFGRAVAEHPEAPGLLALIELLGWASGAITAERSSVMWLGSHNDSQGALDMGLAPDALPGYNAAPRAGMSATEILKAAADGAIKALWIVSDHWLSSAPDRALAEKALKTCPLVIVNEMFLTATARHAHVVFPVASFAEKEGVVVNAERRLQRTARALPPRKGVKADWEIFQLVARDMGAAWSYRGADDIFRDIARTVPLYHGMSWASLLPLGPQWAMAQPAAAAQAPETLDGVPAAGEGLWLLSGGVLFLQGSLSHRGSLLTKLAKDPAAHIHPDEAARLGVTEQQMIALEGPGGAISLPATLDADVPAGSVFVPYAQVGVELNRLGAARGAGLKVRARRLEVGDRVDA